VARRKRGKKEKGEGKKPVEVASSFNPEVLKEFPEGGGKGNLFAVRSRPESTKGELRGVGGVFFLHFTGASSSTSTHLSCMRKREEWAYGFLLS